MDGESPTPSDSGMFEMLCRVYADVLRRQRTASSALVSWHDESQRGHEFTWVGEATNRETLITKGASLRFSPNSPNYESIRKMHATTELNPYEREVLYGYPYLIGRVGDRTIRAPILMIPVAIGVDGEDFTVTATEDVLRFNSLPYRSESNTDARALALQSLIATTPGFPASAQTIKNFVNSITRDIAGVNIEGVFNGTLGPPPTRPHARAKEKLALVDQAAVFIAPKTSYFLVDDLANMGSTESEENADDAWATLLSGAGLESPVEFDPDDVAKAPTYFPFQSNPSQRRVAMLVDEPSTRVVRVSGPPGTGKSLTIANLVCHLAATGRTVLVTSQRDKALEVVDKKLRELALPQLPMTLLRQDAESKRDLRDRLDRIEKERSADEVEREASAYQSEFIATKHRYAAIANEFLNSRKAENEYYDAEQAAASAQGLKSIFTRWRFARTRKRLRRGASPWPDELAYEAQQLRAKLLDSALLSLKTRLEAQTSSAQRAARQQIREFSALLKRNDRKASNFSLFDRLKSEPERVSMLLKLLPVWLMTPDDVCRLFPCVPGLFDVVIVDEASQVDLPSIAPVLYRAKKAVVSGDAKQMQPRRFAFTQSSVTTEAWSLFGLDKLDPDGWFHPTNQSLLDLAGIRSQEEAFLNEHFRSLPPIIEFSNLRWYDGRLRIMTDERRKRFGGLTQPIVELHHVEGGTISGGTQENETEAEALVEKLKQIIDDPSYFGASIGVISLFEEQARLLRDLITDRIPAESWMDRKLVVVNPDGFQGDERDVVLYSLSFDNHVMPVSALSARQMNLDHVQGMLNVGFTRARDEIHIFHSTETQNFRFADGSPGALTDWLAHCERAQHVPRVIRHAGRLGKSDSIFETDVASDLADRGFTIIQQYPSCGYFIDMVAEKDGIRIAIECDGPTHFDEHGHRTIEDIDRLETLERAGWNLINISYRAWKENANEQLARVNQFHAALLNPTDEQPETEFEQGGPAGKSRAVSPYEKSILDALTEGIKDRDSVFKRCANLLGHSRLGSNIRRNLEIAANHLVRQQLIVDEERELFVTPDGRVADFYVRSPRLVAQPRVRRNPPRPVYRRRRR